MYSILLLLYAGSRLPSFGTVPLNTHLFVGEDARIGCTVDQLTDEIRWEKDGVLIEFSERISILPGEGLLVMDTAEDDTGVYACVAVNEEGAMRATAFVNVTGPLLSCNGMYTNSWHSVYACVIIVMYTQDVHYYCNKAFKAFD